MKTFFHKVNRTLSTFTGWLMLAMMVLLVTDIVSRTISRPLQGMAELSVFVMMVVIYLGQARCEEFKDHVNLELVKNALPPNLRRVLELIVYLLALGTVSLLLYAVFLNALSSYQSKESIGGTVELHIWPVKFIMVVGLLFFWIQTLINTVDTAKQFKKRR
jgi:TRAP-type C4-dicarboxylate transport system permease small subunit